jgi:hypothetical protein
VLAQREWINIFVIHYQVISAKVVSQESLNLRESSPQETDFRQLLVLALDLWWTFVQDPVQTEITPSRFLLTLSGSLNSESSMLLRYNIVFVVRIQWLMLRWHIDLFVRQMGAIEVF